MSLLPLLEALGAVTMWSASPALVKLALDGLGPFQLAGVRYFAGFLSLSPLLLIRSRHRLGRLPARAWLRLAVIGLLAYAVGNGLLFWGLRTLPSTTTSFLLNVIPIATLGLGAAALREWPTRRQVAGIVLALFGGAVFFGEAAMAPDGWAVAASVLGGLSIAGATVMARRFARVAEVDTISLAALPMGIGGAFLLLAAPPTAMPPPRILGILAILALVSSALGQILWSHALRGLQAFEISLIGNLMPMGTAALAPLMLGERVGTNPWLGMLIALVGVLLVGWPRGRGAVESARDVHAPRPAP